VVLPFCCSFFFLVLWGVFFPVFVTWFLPFLLRVFLGLGIFVLSSWTWFFSWVLAYWPPSPTLCGGVVLVHRGFGLVFCFNAKRDFSLDFKSCELLQNRKFKLNLKTLLNSFVKPCMVEKHVQKDKKNKRQTELDMGYLGKMLKYPQMNSI
jgi:hypothetical protein